MKLKILLQFRNRYLYIGISLTIFILIMNSFWYVIILFPFSYYIFKRHKVLIKIIVVINVLYLISIFIFNIQKVNVNDSYNVTVVGEIKVDTYSSFLGRIKTEYILVYFDEDITVKPGDKLIIKGTLELPSRSTIPNGFDYSNYLKSQGIKYTMFSKDVRLDKTSFNLYIVPYYIEKYMDKELPFSGAYVKTFILANKSGISEDVIDQINTSGISHLFAVSGLHIAMLVLAVDYLLKKTKLKQQHIENLIIALLLTYLLITSFSSSVTRASAMYILLVINKRYKLEFSTLDILSIIFVFLLIIRPYYYYDPGFVLSFLVTYSILISTIILTNKTKVKQLFLISFIAFLVTIPLILKLNYQINFLSLAFNMIFLLYVSYLILPLSYLAFVLPFIDKINMTFILIFEYILDRLSQIDFLIFRFFIPNDLFVIIYYLLLFSFLVSLENKYLFMKKLFYLTMFLTIICISPNLNPRKSVSFIDVYGDSTFISDSFNRCNILIDTGEHDEYDSVINYLKSKNIRNLDYLVISHFHSDHYGESSDILKEFKVKTVISKHNANEYEDKLLNCGSISMFIYPFEYSEQNENNNSIIMSLFINEKQYLFTGDIENSRESSFITSYDLDIDYLKVPHHGSITSSTIKFLKSINPKEVFIIVSITNLHGHPHSEVVKRYEDLGIPVYRTDLSGTIEVYYLFGKEYKRIHSP